jgi:hypothetical protein
MKAMMDWTFTGTFGGLETAGNPCLKYDSSPEDETNEPVGRLPSERSNRRYESLSIRIYGVMRRLFEMIWNLQNIIISGNDLSGGPIDIPYSLNPSPTFPLPSPENLL